MKKKLWEHKWALLGIVIFSIISMLPLLCNTHRLGHDTNFHTSNATVIESYISLDDPFPALISPRIANNLGYGINLFYPSLPHTILAYTYRIGKIFNPSILDSLTVLYTLIAILSSCFVYWIGMKLFHSKTLSFVAATAFIFFPYRIGDIVVRGALNEVFVFLFMPMILLGLIYLLEKRYREFFCFFVIGYTGLFLSHLVIAMYFTIFLIPFFLVFMRKLFTREVFPKLLLAVGIVTLLVLPFFVTVIEHNLFGNYVVYADGEMAGLDYMEYYSMDLGQYFNPDIDYAWEVPMFLNIFTVIGFVLSFLFYLVKPQRNRLFFFFFLLSFLCFLFSLKNFPWQNIPEIFYMIQFPWRMQTILAISMSLLVPLFLIYIQNPDLRKYSAYLVIACIFISSISYLNNLYENYYTTTDVVEDNLAMGHSSEYLPVHTKNNIDYYYGRNGDVIVLEGDATVDVLESDVPDLTFTVTDNAGTVTLELPRLYYLGYHLGSEDGDSLELFENERGFLTVRISGNGTFTLTYPGTTAHQIASYLQLFTILGIFLTPIISSVFPFRKKKLVNRNVN